MPDRMPRANLSASLPDTSRRDSADLAGACSSGKFVVSRAGEVYDAPESEPNGKSRIKRLRMHFD